jgi:nitric oxide reductase subunit C
MSYLGANFLRKVKASSHLILEETFVLSKKQARRFFLGGTFGFALIFLGLTVDTMRQIPARTHAENITEDVARGQHIWTRNNCMGCHTLMGEGAYYAPELTKVYDRRGPQWMAMFLKDPEAMYPGERKMVNYHFNDGEIQDLIAFFRWVGQMDLNEWPPKPNVGQAALLAPASAQAAMTPAANRPQPATFATICIACHSIGGKGGAVGPALDKVGTRMNEQQIADWLADPQKIRPGTKMPTLPLTADDRKVLAAFLAQQL